MNKSTYFTVAIIASSTAVLSGWMYQQSSQSHCYTELSTILVTTSIFWLVSAHYIKALLKRFPGLRRTRISPLLVHIPISSIFVLGNLLLCQLAIFFVMGIVLRCESLTFNTIDAMMTNNIFVHFCGYFMFLFIFARETSTDPNFPTKENQKLSRQGEKNPSLAVKCGREFFELQPEDVMYITTDKNCIILHTMEKRFVLYQSLKSFLDKPFAARFIRIHRQTAINRRHLRSFHFTKNGDGMVRLKNGTTLKSSRTYADSLRPSGSPRFAPG